MSKISFIYFDVGNVILDFENMFHNIAARGNTHPDVVRDLHKMYDDEACKGNLSTEDLLNAYKNHLTIDPPIESFLDFLIDSFKPNEKVHALLERLIKKYKIGLLTNTYSGVFEQIYEKGIVPKLEYSSIIKSCDHGMVKPDQNFYELAEREANTPGNEILFIDDNKNNLEEAKKRGWNTILFDMSDIDKSISEIENYLEK